MLFEDQQKIEDKDDSVNAKAFNLLIFYSMLGCKRLKLCPLVICRVKLLHCIEKTCKLRLIGGETYLNHWVLFMSHSIIHCVEQARKKNRLKITGASSTWDYAFLAGQPWVIAHLAERFREGSPLLPKHECFHSSPFSSPSALRPRPEGVREHKR